MGKISNALFNGESGEQYRFEVYTMDTVFRTGLPGVFVIAHRYKLPEGHFTLDPIYVGEREDLSLLTGLLPNQRCIQQHKANVKCIFRKADEDRREYIKEDILDFYDPPCND